MFFLGGRGTKRGRKKPYSLSSLIIIIEKNASINLLDALDKLKMSPMYDLKIGIKNPNGIQWKIS